MLLSKKKYIDERNSQDPQGTEFDDMRDILARLPSHVPLTWSFQFQLQRGPSHEILSTSRCNLSGTHISKFGRKRFIGQSKHIFQGLIKVLVFHISINILRGFSPSAEQSTNITSCRIDSTAGKTKCDLKIAFFNFSYPVTL